MLEKLKSDFKTTIVFKTKKLKLYNPLFTPTKPGVIVVPSIFVPTSTLNDDSDCVNRLLTLSKGGSKVRDEPPNII